MSDKESHLEKRVAVLENVVTSLMQIVIQTMPPQLQNDLDAMGQAWCNVLDKIDKEGEQVTNIKVEIFNQEEHDGEWPGTNAAEFIVWFQEKISTIPEEFRGSASIEIDSVGGYDGDHYSSIVIDYSRPKTAEETARSERAEQERHESTRLRELKQLEELKRKYGD